VEPLGRFAVTTCSRYGNEYANTLFLSVCRTSACDSIYIYQRRRVAKARKHTVVLNDLRTYDTSKFASQLDFPHLLSIHIRS